MEGGREKRLPLAAFVARPNRIQLKSMTTARLIDCAHHWFPQELSPTRCRSYERLIDHLHRKDLDGVHQQVPQYRGRSPVGGPSFFPKTRHPAKCDNNCRTCRAELLMLLQFQSAPTSTAGCFLCTQLVCTMLKRAPDSWKRLISCKGKTNKTPSQHTCTLSRFGLRFTLQSALWSWYWWFNLELESLQ